MGKETIVLNDLLASVLGEGFKVLHRENGGMMNISLVVEDKKGKKYLVYIPNGKANKAVNREYEYENSKIMEELNLTSKFVYFDTRLGIKIKEYVEGDSLNHLNDYDVKKVSELLHCIHDSDKMAPNDYHPLQRLANYENKALSFKEESNEYRRLKDFLTIHIKDIINKHKVFSHNDFQKSNILKDLDGNYSVIDFEFCGNNDEVYDIACFANDRLEDGEQLLEAYFNNNVPNSARRRFYLWRIFVSLQWHTVAITKHYQGEGKNTGINFLAVADHFINIAKQAKAKFEELF